MPVTFGVRAASVAARAPTVTTMKVSSLPGFSPALLASDPRGAWLLVCQGRPQQFRHAKLAKPLAPKPLLHTRGISRARSFNLEVMPWAPTRLTSCISHPGPEESSGASTWAQTAQARP